MKYNKYMTVKVTIANGSHAEPLTIPYEGKSLNQHCPNRVIEKVCPKKCSLEGIVIGATPFFLAAQ